MPFFRWLRSNSEHALLRDAQRRIAAKYDANPPARPHGLEDRWWRQIFAPVYRFLPWGLRRAVMQAMPGSHRMGWPKPEYLPPGDH
ncbi:hypothetical protein AB0E63_20615 [Kribbella sp. NPDC026596]|uniref:hypothetical protein n=1 Tax=Kribbella sp. NPDC026596 TaxID=3155122 RepID=UPI0033D26193